MVSLHNWFIESKLLNILKSTSFEKRDIYVFQVYRKSKRRTRDRINFKQKSGFVCKNILRSATVNKQCNGSSYTEILPYERNSSLFSIETFLVYTVW